MRKGAFATEISFFDEFFRVIPRGATRSHCDGNKQSGYDCPDQQATEHDSAERLDDRDRNDCNQWQ